MSRTRLLMADDHTIILEGIGLLLADEFDGGDRRGRPRGFAGSRAIAP